MRHTKKTLGAAVAAALALTMAGTAVAAPADEEVSEAPLYTWNGSSYTDVPVPYSPHGNPAQVMIPTDFQDVKEDFRTAWVGTIFNLHFPKTSGQEEFVTKFQGVLDNLANYHMNAIIFQVRPEQDAWYPSELGNPWSKYLTPEGVEGTDPGFDPLAVMVEMAHQAGLEYHAWFNPYRVTNTKVSLLDAAGKQALEAAGYTLAEIAAGPAQLQVEAYVAAGLLDSTNFAAQHPEWVMKQDEKLFLNPGVPEVQQHIIDTMAEVATNYDIDAIHFDDYFYPNGFGAANLDPLTAADAAQFAEYGEGYPETTAGLEDWRRDNVTNLVRGVHEMLSAHNDLVGTSVQFGISPAGIWNHNAQDPLGSFTPTGSMSSYLRLYCDTYRWVKEELLDYVMPQIYWGFETGAAPYGELARWWNSIAEGTRVQVYVGHANYKVNASSLEWTNPMEIPNQLRFDQTLGSVKGEGFYSYNEILPSSDTVLNETNEVIKEYWDYTALVPAKDWLSHGVSAPANLVVEDGLASWTSGDTTTSRFYIVYRGSGSDEEIIADAKNIVARIWAGEQENVSLPLDDLGGSLEDGERLVVTTTNAAGVESAPATAPVAEFKVTFDPQNGDDVTVVDVTAGEVVAEPEMPVRDGFEFVGWSTAAESYEPYDFASPVDAALTLFGHWSPIEEPVEVDVRRLAGANRYETNLAVNDTIDAKTGGTVFVATGADFADALSAGPAATINDAPLFLAATNSIPTKTLAQIKELQPKRVYVIGGTGAISSTVVTQLREAAGVMPLRVGGVDRYETSAKVFQAFFSGRDVDTVFVATGLDYPDALSASAAGGALDAPVLLVNGAKGGNVLHSSSVLMKRLGVETVAITGGTGAVNASIESNLSKDFASVVRLGGDNRYATNLSVNDYLTGRAGDTALTGVWVATGRDFPDALSASVPAGQLTQRLVLSDGKCLPKPVVSEWIYGEGSRVDVVTLVGGEGVLAKALEGLPECQ